MKKSTIQNNAKHSRNSTAPKVLIRCKKEKRNTSPNVGSRKITSMREEKPVEIRKEESYLIMEEGKGRLPPKRSGPGNTTQSKITTTKASEPIKNLQRIPSQLFR